MRAFRLTAWVALCAIALVSGCASRPVHSRSGLQVRPTRAPEVAPKLAAALRAMAERLAPSGVTMSAPTVAGFLASGARQSYPLELAPRACVTLVSLATEGIVDMDAALYTPDGRLLAADSQPDSHPSLQICGGDKSARYYLVLQSYEGSGSFVVVTLASDRASFGRVAEVLGGRPAQAHPAHTLTPVQDRLQAFSSGLAPRGYRPKGEPVAVTLSPRQRIRLPLSVRAGQCYAVAAFAHEGLRNVQLRIFDERGGAVAGDVGPLAAAQVHFCASAEAEYGVEAHARQGDGGATFVVLEGPSHRVLGLTGRWIGKTEASRLETPTPAAVTLSKLEEQAAADGRARVIKRMEGYLQPREAATHEVLLREGRCYVVVGAGDAGLELSMKLVGPSASGASAWPAGTPVEAGAQLCADATGLARVRLLAVVGAGAYQLVVLQR